MKLEPEKYYVAKNGEKAGPMEAPTRTGEGWRCRSTRRLYTSNGLYAGNEDERFIDDGAFDLVAEWTDPTPAPDYNNGAWHAWTGGECPVHPQSEVEMIATNGCLSKFPAKYMGWQSGPFLFRVVEAYQPPKEPEEVWCDDGGRFWDARDEALAYSPSGKPRLFREVLE